MMDVRPLLTAEEANGVAATVVDGAPGLTHSTALRIVDQAVAFVVTAARNPGAALVPSRVVDAGWHALILHTGLYERLCVGLGQFVHHCPERPNPGRFNPEAIERTIAAIEATGYAVDRELWGGPTGTLGASVAASCQHSDDTGPIVIKPKPKPKGAFIGVTG
ncbi:glycine-rich domain-containing protein [Streptomyces syringium]|uniref:glycine-rich domain-containing protein n=1 Tax=Streptomyces syringium TaxID=76729 RepID=UPI003681DE5C